MPPRFAYWTILVDGLPTAFRAAQREEIEPTFRRLRQKHPDAEMRWFARGKLWASPAEATAALRQRSADADRQSRDRSWRPGGTHRDPRQPYKDAKKRENQKRRERRFEFKQGSRPQAPGTRRDEERPTWEGSRPQTPGFRPLADTRPKDKGEGQKQERPRWEKPGPKWSKPPRRDWRPETGDRRPPTGDQRPPKKGPRPQAPGSRRDEERPKWDRPGPKWGPPKSHEWKGHRPQATGSRPHEERPKWTRTPGEEKADGGKPWKPKSRPGAWSPKPGARKGPRGPR